MKPLSEEKPREIRSFVNRNRRLSPAQEISLRELAGKYCVPYSGCRLDWGDFFPPGPVILEIGFGMGRATAEIAEKNRDVNYLGLEIYRIGVLKLLQEIELRGLQNLRLIGYDAVKVIENMLPDDSLSGVHIFFPDPWPKKRHHKRRLIQPAFMDLLLPKLKREGYIYCATDWEDYASQMRDVFAGRPDLEDWAAVEGLPDWRPMTAFEKKGLAKKHLIREFFYRKIK